MLLFLPVLLLILAAIALSVLNRYRPVPRAYWYTSLAGSLLAALGLLFLRFRLPQEYIVLFAGLGEVEFRAAWLLDTLNWPLAFSLTTLLVAVCLVRVDRVAVAAWQYWAGYLVLGAASLFAVLAGDLLALLLSWTMLDVIVLIFDFQRLEKGDEFRRAIYQWGMRLAASFGVIWALVAFGARGNLTLEAIPERAALLLIFSAGLRLGFLPSNKRMLSPPAQPLTLSVLITVGTALPAFSLLAHVAQSIPPIHSAWLLIPLSSALFASFKSFVSEDEFAAFPFWAMALSSTTVAVSMMGLPLATVALGMLFTLTAPLLWLARSRERFVLPLAAAGFVTLAGLPATPAYQLAVGFGQSGNLVFYLFMPVWALLAAAWLKHGLQPLIDEEPYREGAFGLYLLGLLLLPSVFILFGLGLASGFEPAFDLPQYLPWLIAIIFGGAAFLFRDREIYVAPGLRSRIESIFSLSWLYAAIAYLVRAFTAVLRLIGGLLEGEAGVLWALLIVALLLSMISQFATSV